MTDSARWRGWRLARVTRTGAGALRVFAAHYVQDLTQLYHASAAPGESLPGMLWANTAAALGMPAAKQALVILQAGTSRWSNCRRVGSWTTTRGAESDAERALHDTGLGSATRVDGLSPARWWPPRPPRPGRRPTPPVTDQPARYVNDPGTTSAASGASDGAGP